MTGSFQRLLYVYMSFLEKQAASLFSIYVIAFFCGLYNRFTLSLFGSISRFLLKFERIKISSKSYLIFRSTENVDRSILY
ncbi:hypothetical protein GFO_2657 [Christiangramia forsetii KT0803]|uniref:Uncharacterized protein n=1 Tax=Christiangramia forsetii (strain DSM 17595 / CGMCC 1.15422 / KT0803) TaxID=411154 RepID=A0M4R8_CHRFK|nr:hypothetical protein GFO_2657 [Christiangramia forsetii KT0803]